jgi:hypothetical protein
MLDRCKAAARQSVWVLSEEWLARGITSSKCEKANDGGVEIDLSANESLSPCRIDQKGMSEDEEHSAIISTSDEDGCAAGMRLEIEPRVRRHRASRRSPFDSQCMATTRR